jgi:hypothetical protein
MTDPRKQSSSSAKDDDVMHGRSFAGAEFAATEREQTRDIERTVDNPPDSASDDDDFITDAEMEKREANGET